MIAGLLALYVVPLLVLCWALCCMSAWQDAEEAQRELVALLAEQADDRAIAENLDI